MDFEKNMHGRIVDLPEMDGRYTLLSHEVYTIERHRKIEQVTHNIDMFGPGWIFFKGSSNEGEIAIVQDGKKIVLGKKIIGYIPGKNVIEWILPKGEISYEMLVCGIQLKTGTPQQPISIIYEDLDKSIFDLFELFFDQVNYVETMNLMRTTQPSALSIQVQDWIHKNWNINFKLQDIAKELNTSPSIISRYFKKAFGMSPLKYVNKLRVISSVRDLLKSQRSISQISYEMGFGDPRQFNEHFRQIYPVKPFAFKK
ncbi:MAG: helix-turn-helix transcriptional regulator [Bdellovibrionaceae bacterium]|nr:helix-turn-helix transcriptional regulator [Pseudobdellovibrionaceae bacterium]